MTEKVLREIYKETENIFNMKRKDYPANKFKKDKMDIIKDLIIYKELLNNTLKEEKITDEDNYETKLIINSLYIYSYFINIINDTYKDKIENVKKLYLTQVLIAKRINDLEELIQDLQDILNYDEAKNKSHLIIKKEAKEKLNSTIKSYEEFSEQLLTIIEVLSNIVPKIDLENVGATESDLIITQDYLDEVENFSKKISENNPKTYQDFKYKMLNLKNIDSKKMFPNNENPDKLKEELNKVIDIFDSSPSELHKMIIFQYEQEYIGIFMSMRIFELEILLKKYMNIIDNI